MSAIHECSDPASLATAVDHAARVIADGDCIVLPTDTVYGIGCDAFSPAGVQSLLAAKGRTRQMPPPVLISHAGVLDGLADEVSPQARALAEAFWPGALTIVCWAQPSLGWDLGETHGTVALRVPDDDVARALLERVGPMAVSSANLTGHPAAETAEAAEAMLGERVALYLSAGPRPAHDRSADAGSNGPAGAASTIVDCTGEIPVVLRLGAIGVDRLREVVPELDAGEFEDTAAQEPATPEDDSETEPAGPDVTEGTEAHESAQTEHPRNEQAWTEHAWSERPGAARQRPGHAASSVSDVLGTDASDEDVVSALVASASGDRRGAVNRGAVDQDRARAGGEQPRWHGTPALPLEDATRLVTGH